MQPVLQNILDMLTSKNGPRSPQLTIHEWVRKDAIARAQG